MRSLRLILRAVSGPGRHLCVGADRFDSGYGDRLCRRSRARRGDYGQEPRIQCRRATATSSGTGAYSMPILQPGTYDVTVKVASFKTFHVSDLPLTVGQVLPLNVQLEPGAVTEEVQVRADQIPDVDLETSQVSNLVDARSIKDLPLITRNPYELVLLSPGTSQTNRWRNLGQWFAGAEQ